jgi:hypothetical protein
MATQRPLILEWGGPTVGRDSILVGVQDQSAEEPVSLLGWENYNTDRINQKDPKVLD